MAGEPQSTRPGVPPPPLLARLGLSGLLLAVGGIVGIIATFLPLGTKTVSARAWGPFPFYGVNSAETTRVASHYCGGICLLGYIAAVVLAYIFYASPGLRQKSLGWVAAGVGVLVAVMAVWLLVVAELDARGSFGVTEVATTSVSLGVGAYLNLATAAAVAAGGIIRAHQDRLI
jgi:hypothetical protein